MPSATWPSWFQTRGSLVVWVYKDLDVFLCQREAHSCSPDMFYHLGLDKAQILCHASTEIWYSWEGSGRRARIFSRAH